VVPLVRADDPETAVAVSNALANGGLSIVEVVLRTPGARDCLEAIVKELPEVRAGAGTVLNAEQAADALRRGAAFLVSPGLDRNVVAAARDAGVPIFPGVATATELQAASNLGLETVKFFPAAIAGGVAAIKTFASVFGHMRFMPTGGVDARNLEDYLALPQVLACGGSWLTPREAVEAGDFETIERLAREAVSVARVVRGS